MQKKTGWAPAQMGRGKMGCGCRSEMGRAAETMGNSVMGISILSALSIAGIHSAVNPSYFTLRSFASKPEAKKVATEGLWIGLGLGLLGSFALYGVFHRAVPALVSAATAVGLFGVGLYAVSAPELKSMPPIDKQGETAAPGMGRAVLTTPSQPQVVAPSVPQLFQQRVS
jgi:hypothetical protein